MGARRLAAWMDAALGQAGSSSLGQITPRSVSRGENNEVRWWQSRWKSSALKTGRPVERTLPTSYGGQRALPEATLLKPIAFGDDEGGKRRRSVAQAVSKGGARNHTEACRAIARAFPNEPECRALPAFARFADAAVDCLRYSAAALSASGGSRIRLSSICRGSTPEEHAQELVAAAKECRRALEQSSLPHTDGVWALLRNLEHQRTQRVIEAVLAQHALFGTAIRWLEHRDGWLYATRPEGPSDFRYRFRLWPLARLAVQCGILRGMPKAVSESFDGAVVE